MLQALHDDRREDAIERLRRRRGISAEEAAERIDRYLEENPPLPLRGLGVVASSRLNALIVMMGLVHLLLVG